MTEVQFTDDILKAEARKAWELQQPGPVRAGAVFERVSCRARPDRPCARYESARADGAHDALAPEDAASAWDAAGALSRRPLRVRPEDVRRAPGADETLARPEFGMRRRGTRPGQWTESPPIGSLIEESAS